MPNTENTIPPQTAGAPDSALRAATDLAWSRLDVALSLYGQRMNPGLTELLTEARDILNKALTS